jgi:hypothetical protein
VLFGVLATCANGHAEPTRRLGHQLTLVLRAELPYTALTINGGSPQDGFWTMGGGSVAAQIVNWVEVEVGGRLLVNPCRLGPELGVRAGAAPALLDRRAQPRQRWTLRVPLLIGYSYLPTRGGGCDKATIYASHALVFASGLDATVWLARLGVTFRVLGFGGGELAKAVSYGQASRGAVSGFLASIGIAIPLLHRVEREVAVASARQNGASGDCIHSSKVGKRHALTLPFCFNTMPSNTR